MRGPIQDAVSVQPSTIRAMSVTSASPPRRNPDLQPLVTRPDTPDRRRCSQIPGSKMVRSTAMIPSPSIVAARAYHLELTTPIGLAADAQQRRRSLFEEQLLPRRHSAVSSTGTLTTQLEKFTISSDSGKLYTVPEETGPKIKVEDDDDEIRQGIESKEVDVLPKSSFCQVPFQYTHDHLRDWGHVYLGKSATADAFVNAVALRRQSMAVLQEDVRSESTSLVTIRARVTPKAKEKKPFLIQRQFELKNYDQAYQHQRPIVTCQ